VLALAAKVKYVIDPKNPYPNNYTGHVRATMKDGSVTEERQLHLRGGAREPLTRQDVTDKFALNTQHGGWTRAQSDATLKLLAGLYQGKMDLSSLQVLHLCREPKGHPVIAALSDETADGGVYWIVRFRGR